MLDVTLFTKSNCGLCDDAKAELKRLAASYPLLLTEVDITQDPELFERYRFNIPVVQVAGQELRAPIAPADLETALTFALAEEE